MEIFMEVNMKKIIALIFSFIIAFSLAGCYSPQPPVEPVNEELINSSEEHNEVIKDNVSTNSDILPDDNAYPVNYMDEIKNTIHDELFKEETDQTREIVDRIFKHLKYETIETVVNGDEAYVLMVVENINAGQAWIDALEKYAALCAENLFSKNYDDVDVLYNTYLDEFESMVKKSNYIQIPVVIEMEFVDYRWIWDLDDDTVNALTGFLLAALDGEYNSFSKDILALIDDDVEDKFDIKLDESYIINGKLNINIP